MNDQKSNKERMTAVPGLAVLGLMITGIAGLFHAYGNGEGVSLVASALAFGIIFYVSFN